MKEKMKLRLNRIYKVLLLVVGIIIVIGIIAITPTFVASDGTTNYSGVKLEAARSALKAANGLNGTDKLGSKPQIVSVQRNTQDSCSDNPDDKYYYSVTIKQVWLFGVTKGQATYNICRVEG